MAYTLSTEEFELLKSARLLGGAKKVKELLKILEKHNIDVENLISYLKSIDYKVPNPLELRVAELEKRVSDLEARIPTQKIEITLPKYAIKYKVLNIPKKFRLLFPGYKVPFTLETNIGEIVTSIVGGSSATKKGDPAAGSYFHKGLSKWFTHNDVKEGDIVVIEIVEPHKRYKLYKKPATTS